MLHRREGFVCCNFGTIVSLLALASAATIAVAVRATGYEARYTPQSPAGCCGCGSNKIECASWQYIVQNRDSLKDAVEEMKFADVLERDTNSRVLGDKQYHGYESSDPSGGCEQLE